MAATKVYVGNLDFKIEKEELTKVMGEAGHVVNVDLALGRQGFSKGFALVEYETAKDAERAIRILNDRQLGSRPIFVREDRGSERPARSDDRPPRRDNNNSSRRDNNVDGSARRDQQSAPRMQTLRVRPEDQGRLLYVGNLPWRASWQDVKDLFREVGEVIRADIPQDRDGRSRGYATVLFEEASHAAEAIKRFHDTEFEGRRLIVREDTYASGDRQRQSQRD
jgi:RNA recognition motif-containing protein